MAWNREADGHWQALKEDHKRHRAQTNNPLEPASVHSAQLGQHLSNLLTVIAGRAQTVMGSLAENDPKLGHLQDIVDAAAMASQISQELMRDSVRKTHPRMIAVQPREPTED